MNKVLLMLSLISIGCIGCESGSPKAGDIGNGGADGDSDGDTDSDTADGTTGGTENSTDDPNAECFDFPWEVEIKPINMLVLLDRSKSMEKYTVDGSDDTYAEVVRDAIDAIIQQHTSSGIINFALNVFPSPAMCTPDYGDMDAADQSAAVLCQAASQFTTDENPYNPPEVAFAETISSSTHDAIRQVLAEVGNCGGTPITKSLQWARNYLNSLDLEDDTYVLLATDGAPSCNLNASLPCESSTPGAEAEAAAQCLDDLDSVHAAFDLARDGYKTFVVGVGSDIAAFSDLMDVIAYTGGGHMKEDQESLYDIEAPPDGGNWYYPATDSETLSAVLEDVTNAAISCEYEVDWASIPDMDYEAGRKVVKSCSQTRVFGIPEGSDTKVELTYMESCSDENVNASDPQMQLGWTWAEHEGSSWESIEAIGEDVSKCTRVKLCNNACSQLKTIRGVKVWTGISATFGCKPVILIV